MKHSLHTVLTLLFVCASAWGENVPWQNPQINEINREPAHAHFIPYTNEANALKQQALPAAQRFAVNPATERRISLDGTWKFLFSKNNEECPTDFYKMGYNTKRWKDIQVPGSWELQGFDSPIYTDVAYPFPANPPHVPTDYNPVGAYVREFTVPAHWKGMDIFLDFEGVESAFYCWVNGELAGYSEDSRLPAHFNITPFLKTGKNKLAVKVFRYSDGSYLEDQDYWKYMGTLAGCAVVSLFLSHRSVTDCMAVGAGFGYYSLSSIFITEYKGPELGTIALLSNITREIITLLFAPLLVRWFGNLAPISAGGATTMDTTLPIITRYSGQSFVVVSIFHGFVVDFSVPFLVTLFCSI